MKKKTNKELYNKILDLEKMIDRQQEINWEFIRLLNKVVDRGK